MSGTRHPVNWFEIPMSEVERAKGFYEAVFGLEMTVQEIGPTVMVFFPWVSEETPGAPGALTKHAGFTPSHEGTMVYFPVADINGTLEKIGANGGKTLMPKTSIGEYGYIAHFEDSEGNRVGLHAMS